MNNINKYSNTEDKKIKIINIYTEEQMFSKYGYIMSEEYGKDIELLLDILKEYGLNFKKKNNYYYCEEEN